MPNDVQSKPSGPFRRKAEEWWLRSIRAYTFNTPIKKGSYRLFLMAQRLCEYPHTNLRTKTKDGRTMLVDLTSGMEESVFFHGVYEPVLTRIATGLIGRGDVCADIGANFGWYSTLFAKLVGKSGSVHAFEPVPRMFDQLTENRELLDHPEIVTINQKALGDHAATVSINLFEGESTGHASIASKGRADIESFECQMITFDSYLKDREIDRVDFIKVDIEGAELKFLEGARSIFSQDVPPIFLMEMALEQSQHFGYRPNDLLDFLFDQAEYLFYSVDEIKGNVRQITAFADDDIGANVFCIPRSASAEKHLFIAKYLG